MCNKKKIRVKLGAKPGTDSAQSGGSKTFFTPKVSCSKF